MSAQTAENFTEFSNSNLEIMYSAEEIRARVAELGAQITAEYAGKDLVMVGVVEEREQRGLGGVVGAGGIAEGGADAAIGLGEDLLVRE